MFTKKNNQFKQTAYFYGKTASFCIDVAHEYYLRKKVF